MIVTLIAGKPPIKLTPLELAVGEELTKSRKRRRELIDMSYHRSVNLLTVLVVAVVTVVVVIEFSGSSIFQR